MDLLTVLLAGLVALPPAAAGVYRGREKELKVAIPRMEAAVTMDGELKEPEWAKAALLTGFSQYVPQDMIPAADSTHVLVWYSPTAMHVGIRAFQPRATVRATLADRDKISQDDHIQLFLGTYNDGRQATVLMMNPLGIQADGTLSERGTLSGGGFSSQLQTRETPDLSPDFVYQSKGHVTDWGYEIEVSIPFKSLRYQAANVQDWGFNVVRKVQYRGYEDSWAPAQRAAASFLAQSGSLTGLTDLRRGLVVDITPEATQRTVGSTGACSGKECWKYDGQDPKFGANVRWGITNNLTMNGTVNPDFSQVEADASQITFDPRAAINFPERRPFFLDGIEQFATPNSLIYTRRVVQPLAAAKVAGKTNGFDIAYLTAIDATSSSTSGTDRPFFNIVRLQRDLGGQSRLGLVATDREDGKNWNRVVGLDGRIVWQKIHAFSFQYAQSATDRLGVRTQAPLWETRYTINGRAFGLRTLFNGIADDFRTQSGFISRTGQIHANANPRYTWIRPRGSLIEQVSGDVNLDQIWAYRNFERHGDARDKKLHFNVNSQWRGGWTGGASLLLETFGYDPAFYSKYRIEVPRSSGRPSDTLAFTGTPRLPNRDWVVNFGTPQLKYFSFNVVGIIGQDENFYEWAPADIRYVNLTANVRASEKLRATFTFTLQDYLRQSDGTRVGRQRNPRLKVEYQMTRSMFVRVIGDYFADETDVLRDEGRTNNPLLVFNAGSKKWVRTVAGQSNSFRPDFLFSYRPVPGTVFYAGYGAQMTDDDAFSFTRARRLSDAFFLKASYLWRL
jgi:hypothetical protein